MYIVEQQFCNFHTWVPSFRLRLYDATVHKNTPINAPTIHLHPHTSIHLLSIRTRPSTSFPSTHVHPSPFHPHTHTYSYITHTHFHTQHINIRMQHKGRHWPRLRRQQPQQTRRHQGEKTIGKENHRRSIVKKRRKRRKHYRRHLHLHPTRTIAHAQNKTNKQNTHKTYMAFGDAALWKPKQKVYNPFIYNICSLFNNAFANSRNCSNVHQTIYTANFTHRIPTKTATHTPHTHPSNTHTTEYQLWLAQTPGMCFLCLFCTRY